MIVLLSFLLINEVKAQSPTIKWWFDTKDASFGQSAAADQVVLFTNEGTDIQVEATEDSIVLILSGEPINEPIFPYGPFLMNTREEIIQAYEDLNNGKFGYLAD